MKAAARQGGISRRGLLVTGGAGIGLVVAWALWPRRWHGALPLGEREHGFGAWLKIGEDGRVIVAMPVVEHGQGAFTALAQIAADELGADWRTVGVEVAPPSPLYANRLAAEELLGDAARRLPLPAEAAGARAMRLMLTGGSSSVRQFEPLLREAAAEARVRLCMAAARDWGVDWRSCTTGDGFVTAGERRERFGVLAAAAAGETPPDAVALRNDDGARLAGMPVPRLDTPAKVDGSANFAGDIRLPGMVFAAIRQGPLGDTRLVAANRAAADAVPGMRQVVATDRWIAAIATNGWAAERGLDALAPRFETRGAPSDVSVAAALDAAFDRAGGRMHEAGDVAGAFAAPRIVTAGYRVAPGLHAAIELPAATAAFADGRLRLWLATLAPASARAAAARVLGIGEERVTVIAMQLGGSFGAGLDTLVAEQAALLAQATGRPVQLSWSRAEDIIRARPRPPAAARMRARLDRNGRLTSWHARIATPPLGHELAGRLLAGDAFAAASLALPGSGDAAAVAGAVPPYAIGSVAVDHHAADIGFAAGHLRGGAHGASAFFTESFIDELARLVSVEPNYFRIQMLGQNARLANCLNTVASLGGWQGGVLGSGQGIACHAMRGSHIAILAEARIEGGRVRCDRLVAAVDCGRVLHPDLVLQQIEGGLIFGLAQATGCTTPLKEGLAERRRLADLRLPMLSDIPDITVEIIRSEAEPGGVGEIAVPPVAPAIANAVMAASGLRLRRLPLDPANP
ncbi:molybdopterin cofactor-binding domain-containing protein [Sphingomonas baiyangensis]|uniref:Xanthine dehydrogenase family protein molybdopterin-binding subunit n=1 Tax=Sphingomonas baiyangensis TaxID=2572576 RepID=A0A4U1L992_9SPHN|nr:molybdopterin cofactor-binding domain-containing protein [Sphingomonas baiyangensis]TKD52940.1 xanthine dehydrogenase family protein molybdopterin-binding subunit [Sphingomonas baiyangensis]